MLKAWERRPCLSMFMTLTLALTGACRDSGPSMAERAAATKAAQDAIDAKTREEGRARREAQRLLELWRYQTATVGGAPQVTAAILTTDGVDTDGSGAKPVQLVFRDHAAWGRSGYLVLQAGDFACRARCTVVVTVDDRPPQRLAAWRPDTDEAIALFIRETATLWRLTGDASRLRIEFPVAAGGTRIADFEVAGLDESQMSGW